MTNKENAANKLIITADLLQAQKEYIIFLSEEVKRLANFAHTHGIIYPKDRYELGVELSNRIKAAEIELTVIKERSRE